MNTETYSLDYIAGFFDGEGSVNVCVHRSKKKPHHKVYEDFQLTVSVVQKCSNAAVLFYMRNRWGGSVYLKDNSKSKKHSDAYLWQVTLRKAEAFLKDIHPYVHIKRQQVELGLEMMSRRRPQSRPMAGEGGRWDTGAAFKAKMHDLNCTVVRGSDFPVQ